MNFSCQSDSTAWRRVKKSTFPCTLSKSATTRATVVLPVPGLPLPMIGEHTFRWSLTSTRKSSLGTPCAKLDFHLVKGGTIPKNIVVAHIEENTWPCRAAWCFQAHLSPTLLHQECGVKWSYEPRATKGSSKDWWFCETNERCIRNGTWIPHSFTGFRPTMLSRRLSAAFS